MGIQVPHVEEYKIINDPIHGYIPVTKAEHEILQVAAFNRLHHLKQLSMAYMVFPGAVGTRFMHSLGAMHVASKVAYQLLGSFDKRRLSDLIADGNPGGRLSEVVETVRLAALMHDVGHGPFSHTSEGIMLACMSSKKHRRELEEAKKLFGVQETAKVPIHEYYSCKIIETRISGVLRKCKRSWGRLNTDNVIALLTHSKTVKQDLFTDNGLEVFRMVISSQLDADRMDYLLRDAYFSGVPYGRVDIDRVIRSLQLRTNKLGKYEVAVHERGLAAVEDMLDARFKMYKWLASHHLVVALDELMRLALIWLVADSKALSIDDFYWDQMVSKQVTDMTILAALKDTVSLASPYAGLVDRAFLPTSLLKRPDDHRTFQVEAGEIAGKLMSSKTFRHRLEDFIGNLYERPSRRVSAEQVLLLGTVKPRSQYSALEWGAVSVCSDKPNAQLTDLLDKSPYFDAVNNEWSEFPSYYISYVVPGMKKAEATRLKDKIRTQIARELASG